MRLAFEDFVVDDGRRLVTRDGEVIHLAPKPYALLELLLSRRPEAVGKDEILDRLWGGAAISETALTTVVNELRQALGETARAPRCLRTVHGFGYAFAAETRELESAPPVVRGLLVGSELRLTVLDGESTLGRNNPATLLDPSISRRHARLLADATGVAVEDLGSKNGTFVNETRVERAVPLADGDELRLGFVRLVFRAVREDGRTETAR